MVDQRFHIVNLGCKVNRVEADALAASLIACGSKPVSEEDADLIVVNTCTVTGEADKKARKAVRHALTVNPRARVVVTGCAVAIDPDEFAKLDGRVDIVQRAELVVSLANRAQEEQALPVAPSAKDAHLRYGDGFRTRVGIKVQDGCNHACTYCIVHVARGKAVSVPFAQAVAEARAYLQRGVKEVVLTGIDLASYRSDGMGLAQLTEAILDQADAACEPGQLPARVRVSSIEPQTINEDFIGLLAQGDGRVCRHLHLPLQSGSTQVLRQMARPYTAEDYAQLIAHLRDLMPTIAITTDIICGFPGETDDDFQQTMDLARECRFSKIHVFPYSLRAGTPAAARTDQVPAQVKARRAAQLRELSDSLRAIDLAERKGTSELAIVEGVTALTESYHELPTLLGAAAGSLIPVVYE